jgi:GTPase SAR1 family protein
MRDLYYKNGEGFLFVYSVTDTSSIEDVKERYDSLLKNRVGLLHPPIHRCPQRG